MARKSMKVLFLTAVLVASMAPAVLAEEESSGDGIKDSFWGLQLKASFSDVVGAIDILSIVVGSIAGIALIVEHALNIRRTTMIPELTVAQIKTMFDERRFREALEFCQNDPSYVAGVVHAGLIEAANGYSAMEKAMSDAAEERSARLYRKIEYLNLIGNICPMLGLFGTVWGMMVCFHTIASKGGTANPTDLATGIMLALFSTFLGMVAAMPALTGYAIFKNRIEQFGVEASLVASELLANFKPSKAPAQKQA